jgi:ferric-dicitrate binding protein FerR (iron transport regulator)
MRSVHRYANHSSGELATEPEFINWVNFPNENSDRFWAEYLVQYPLQSKEVNTARFIVMQMHIVEDSMPEQNAVETWDNIKSRIELNSDRSKAAVILLRRWTAAAAVLLLLASAAYLVWKKTSLPNALAVNRSTPQAPKNDVAPGGNKAILTLADGTEVVLDSTNNGAITKQGNVTVIKLDDGQLSYKRSASTTSSTISYNTVSTPRGGQYQLVLTDGTKVWLNAASSLRFPTSFIGNDRRVEITGEAYFEVAHDNKKPFFVAVADMNVEVLGTHFNINAYPDERTIKTTLLEGAVKVESQNQSALLVPGEQARLLNAPLEDGNRRLQTINHVDLEQVVAWKNGKFQFNQASVETIMRQVSRWYDVEVVFEGPIPDKRFNGKMYRNVNASQVLSILEEGGIHFRIEGNKVTVTP